MPGAELGIGNATLNQIGWPLVSWYLVYSGEERQSPKNYINSHAMINCEVYSVGKL